MATRRTASTANAAAILADSAERAPEAVAVRHGETTLTYEEVQAAADRVTAAVVAIGLSAGDRVVLVGGIVPGWVSAYHGLLSAGAVVVAVNPMAVQAEIEYFLRDSGAALALGLGDAADRVRAAADAVACPYRSVEPGSDFLRDVGDEPAHRPFERDADDVAVLLYTSGTTGRPKGAMLSHGNLLAAAEIFVEELELSDEDSVLVCLPLSHVFGQGCILNPALMAGAAVTLQTRFEAVEAVELIARHRISVFAGVPTMYNAILRAPTAAGQGLGDALRLAISGGAPIPLEVLRRFEARFDCPILEGYGMTESSGTATFNRLSRPRKPGRVGTALPRMSIRVVDEQGREVSPDIVGEVLISGPTVMKGYWNRPEASAEALVGGWLRTGDLGSTDEDGDLAIVDRKKDLIIRGGYNVYPREVEEVLAEHPDVIEVLVVGVADEHFGEEVGAAIVARAGSGLDAAAIRVWTEPRLSPYKRPRVIQFLDALPRTSTGKLARRGLDLGKPRQPVEPGRQAND
jgi:long-chain acyl-CoA synthetase